MTFLKTQSGFSEGRVYPRDDLERRLLCLGAMFVEENFVLDDLFQVIGSDLLEQNEPQGETKVQILKEVDEFFFRLDMNFDSNIREECLAVLDESWNVQSKEAVIESLTNIRAQGHRAKFRALSAVVPDSTGLEMMSLEKFKKIFSFDFPSEEDVALPEEDYKKLAEWFQRSKKYLGDAGILAWDASRYVHFVRLSYLANYLTDFEAWAELSKLAPIVQGRFSSWMEYAQSFLIGRTFWSGVEDPQVKMTCERLLGHPASPWRFYSCL